MAADLTRLFSAGGRKLEVRASVDDGGFRADVREAEGAKRRLALSAGAIEWDVLNDMAPEQQREAQAAIVKAIQDAVKSSFREG